MTIVERRQAASDQDAGLLAAALALGGGGSLPPGCSPIGVFRGYADTAVVLAVADWQSREAYSTWASQAEPNRRLDPLSAGPPQRWFFQLGRAYGVMGRQGAASLCGLIRAPRGAGEATRALWEEGAGMLRAVDGFAHWFAYADEDDPNHFMSITQWESAAAAQAYLAGPALALLPGLLAAEAVVEPFVGVIPAADPRDPVSPPASAT